MGLENSLSSGHSWIQKGERFVEIGVSHPSKMNILTLISEFGLESIFVSQHSIISLN